MKILIWGTGATAKRIIENGVTGEIVGFVRSYSGAASFLHKPVFLPHNITVEYDYIFVATANANAIYKTARDAGLALDKICYLQLPTVLSDYYKDNAKKAGRFMSSKNLAIVMSCSEKDREHNFVLQDLEEYNKLNLRTTFNYDEAYQYFIYSDKFLDAGSIKSAFFQDIWAAKLVRDHNPEWHFDFGSRISGFIGHLLSFRKQIVRITSDMETEAIPGVSEIKSDIVALDAIPDNSLESISVMCSPSQLTLGSREFQHSDAYAKMFATIQQKTAPNGNVYLSVPVGKERIEFGMHPIFSADSVIKAFSDMELMEYSIANRSRIERFVPMNKYEAYTGEDELTGLFFFKKRTSAKSEICLPNFIAQSYKGKAPLGQYFYQDLWAAKLINRYAPEKHFDIGSNVDEFIGHLLSFRESVTLVDIRPLPAQVEGVDFIQADATNLGGIEDSSIESLSALCSLEHFGLGRYGDPIDPEACFKAFQAIQKKMAPGGIAYIAVPVGKERVEFNAHRVFYAKTVIDLFYEMDLIEFSTTNGDGIEYNVPINKYDFDDVKGNLIFGLFCFKKRLT